MTTEATPGALGSNDQLGPTVDAAVIDCWRVNYGLDKTPHELNDFWQDRAPPGAVLALKAAVGEIGRLTDCLKKANDQAEHFERAWYLAKDDADRYAFSKSLEGQVVTMETFKVHGAEALDQALDDAMAEDEVA
jgi:hypothetical protein